MSFPEGPLITPTQVWLQLLIQCGQGNNWSAGVAERIEAATRAETASIILFLYARTSR